jgi:hypothetical protein
LWTTVITNKITKISKQYFSNIYKNLCEKLTNEGEATQIITANSVSESSAKTSQHRKAKKEEKRQTQEWGTVVRASG